MYWARQKVWVENGDPGIGEYKMTIRGDSSLYVRKPAPGGEPVYIKSPSLEGYDTLETAIEELYKIIRFQPTDQGEYWADGQYALDNYLQNILFSLGSPAILSPLWPDTFKEIVSDQGLTIDRCLVGRIRMGGIPRVTCACNEVSPFFDSAYMQEYPGQIFHFGYNMSIFPTEFIKGGAYNFDSIDYDAGTNLFTIGLLNLDIWQDITTGKYNSSATMTAFTYNMSDIWTRYDGKDCDELYDSNDPNKTNQNNNNNGGNGDGDTGDDPVSVPVLPDADMTDAGSVRIYAPTKAELRAFMQYLHSASPAESVIKLWQNPIQGVVSIHYLPYPLDLASNTKEGIEILGIPAGTGVVAYPAKQFQTINFGYVKVGNVKNNYLDYAPYTKIQIYLPGIGIRDLNTDDVMNKYIRVQYNCDNVTGQFVAFVLVGPTSALTDMSVKYTFSGSVAAPFPISQQNWGNTYIAAATLAAGALAGGIAVAGAAGAAASGGGAAAAGAAASAGTAAGEGAAAINAGAVASGVTNIGSAVTSLAKPSVTRAGTVSGTTSLFGVREPYLIIERPNQQDFKDFNKVKGYPCGKTYKLGDLTGYNQIESVHLTNIPATITEINEIENLLKGGVIL